MARFTFKLNGLLQTRLAAERERQRAVAELERQRIAIEERLRRQQSMIDQGRESLRAGLVGTVDAIALRNHAGSTMRLLRDAQQMAVTLAHFHQRLDEARADLIEATAARRAIELLRDRRLAEWKRKQEKQEDGAMDELAVARAARAQETDS